MLISLLSVHKTQDNPSNLKFKKVLYYITRYFVVVYLKSKDDDKEESVCCKKNFVSLEGPTVSKERDDEDECSDSYQGVGDMIQH